jgi:hypothetical protein
MLNKILNLTHGFIEPMGTGILHRCCKSQIKEGVAVNLKPVYRRLKAALKSDDGLMAACIKEATRRGHKLY